MIQPDPTVSWQSAPHLVPKDSPSMFRITIDLRPLNAATSPEVWPMPNLEAELSDFEGSEHFAFLDFCTVYWQMPLREDSINTYGIIAPTGCFTSTRVLHGLKNSTAHFQATIPPLFDELRQNLKAWWDDFTIHFQSENDSLDALGTFFAICKKHNLILSAKTCLFYLRKVKWCG